MKFDLTNIDYTKEVTDQLKKQYDENVNNLIKYGLKDTNDNRNVTLFHGTSLHYLNPILLNGLVPNQETSVSNFEGHLKANEHLVYLTSKWHYWYAHTAYSRLEQEEHNLYNIPCYIECKVPATDLIIDEDFFHSTYIKNRIKASIKRHDAILEVTYKESLNQYATVAHIGKVKREQLVSFTILANVNLLYRNFIDEKSVYQKDLMKWGNGKGKGNLKLHDLFKLEDDPANLTFYMKDIPENQVITEFVPRDGANLFALKFGTVQFGTE